MKKLIPYLLPYWKGLLLATLCIAVSTVCDLLLPTIMSDILNNGIYGQDFAYILRCCGRMLFVCLLGLGALLLGSWFSTKVVSGYCADLRSLIFRKVNAMSFEEFGKLGTAALVTRATHDVQTVSWIASELSSEVPVSVMSQYTPAYRAASLPPLDRTVTKEEYDSVAAAAADFGFVNGWVQGMEAADPKLALLGENMTEGYGAVANNML